MFDKILLVFLPMILFLGAVTSYEDIKQGKIRNKWILIAFAYALLANILIFWVLANSPAQAPRLAYFIELGITVAISLLLGFIMWWIGLWTAGDAKLFAADNCHKRMQRHL